MKVEEVINCFYAHVWKHHDLLEFFMSDQDTQFIFDVWKHICKMLKINVKLSMMYHSEIDDQIKKVNAVMIFFNFFYFFIKCMQSMTMTLSRRCMYAKLHVIWSKSLLYIFSLINHIDSLHIQALSLKLSSSYFRFSLFLCTLCVLLFRF